MTIRVRLLRFSLVELIVNTRSLTYHKSPAILITILPQKYLERYKILSSPFTDPAADPLDKLCSVSDLQPDDRGRLLTHRCLPPAIFMTVASQYHSEPWVLTPFPPRCHNEQSASPIPTLPIEVRSEPTLPNHDNSFRTPECGEYRNEFVYSEALNSPWLPTRYHTLCASSVPILIHRDSTIQSFQPSYLPYLLLQPSPDEPLIRMSTFTRTKENI